MQKPESRCHRPTIRKPNRRRGRQRRKDLLHIEDKNEVAALDVKTHKVVNTWPIAPGEEASGLAILTPRITGFLSVCSNKKMVMMDSFQRQGYRKRAHRRPRGCQCL